MSEQPDIDIQAEANQCHRWWLDQGTRAGPYHEVWQGWKARARLAAEREREMTELLRDVSDAMKRYSMDVDDEPPFSHRVLMERITAALKGPSDDQPAA